MTTDNPTKNATIRHAIEQVISDAKYILVHFSLFDYDRETKTVKDVYIKGVSSHAKYKEMFNEWNSGYESFADSIKVENDIVKIHYLGDWYTVTGVKSVCNWTTKSRNRASKTGDYDSMSLMTY